VDNGDGTYTYYEAAPVDQSVSKAWSNIIIGAVGVTAQGTAIGTGITNTPAIIAQPGHIDSSAKSCSDYSISATHISKSFSLSYNSSQVTKSLKLVSHYHSLRLIKDATTINPKKESYLTNILLNGKCIDPETRCLYIFYIDTYFGSAWIIEFNLDNRVQTVVYYDKYNAIGFDPLFKIYNARVVHGRLVWTDNKNPIYQMDIERAKKSFYYKIGYGGYPNTEEWNETVNYGVDQIVSNGNYFYKSVIAGNIDHEPKSDTGTYWTQLCLIEDAYYSMDVKNFYFEPMPPKLPPVIEYISDDTRKISSLKQTLFQVAYRYIYMDWRKSTFSPASTVPVPQAEEESATGLANEQVSLNNGLKITVNTGGEEVRQIEIVGRSSNDPSKWYLIETIDKFDIEEKAGEVSTLKNVSKTMIEITIPAPIIINDNLVLPSQIALGLSISAPGTSNLYIEASVVDMTWNAEDHTSGTQKSSTITIHGGGTVQVSHIPSWISMINVGTGLPIIESDVITNGEVVALYPNSQNTGLQKNDSVIFMDNLFGYSCQILTTQLISTAVPSVGVIVLPEDPHGLTISDESGVAENGSEWITITFTPNHPLYGPLVDFTIHYSISYGGGSGGTFTARNQVSGSHLIAMSSPATPGVAIVVEVWEGSLT
jgi:hypothetical protein